MKKLYFLFFTILISVASFGQVVISQAYGGGGNTGATYKNDFVELFNSGSTSVSLNGWSIQYASSSGTTWAVTNLTDFTLNPGQYYLIEQAAGTAGTTALPTPDVTGTTAMSGTNFKILLSNSTTAETGSCPTGSQIIDFVGFGSANCSETAAAPVLSNTTAGLRANGGCSDSNNNGADFSASSPNPRNSLSPVSICTSDPTLVLTDAPSSGGSVTTSPEDASSVSIGFATTNFTVASSSAGDGYIKWNVKDASTSIVDSGDIFTTDGTETSVSGLMTGNTYTLFAELVDNSGASLSPAITYTLTVIIPSYTVVADIAALRADVIANGVGKYYEITDAALVTHTDAYNSRQWIQDSNIAGIVIYESNDSADIPFYNIGDNVTGLKGGTALISDLLIFYPTTDSGVVASMGNTVTPQTVTVTDFNTNYADYESELIQIANVTFDAGDGTATFSSGTNYDVSTDTGANVVVMRTDYFSADYIGQIIPQIQLTNLVAIAGRYNTTGQIYVRSLSDLTLNSKSFDIENFNMYPNPTSLGYINISSKNSAKMDVSVFDVLGKQVIKETISDNILNVSKLNAGIYIMKVSQEDASITKKLVIK